MITVIFNGGTAYLLDDLPDWESGFALDAQIPAVIEQGLNGLETRGQRGDTLRLSVKFSCTLEGAAVPALRNALQGLNVQPVLCPLWPAMFQPGDTPPVTAPYYVAIGDDEAPSIHAAADLPLTRQACPLMVGKLAQVPDPNLLAPDVATLQYSFIESDGANIMTPAAFVPTDALAAANGTRPIFPWRPDWATVPVSASAKVDIERQQIGQGRELQEAYYTQDARRDGMQNFTLEGVDIWNLLSFFIGSGSEIQNFWLPMGITEANLTADVAAVDTALNVDNAPALAVGAFVVLDDLTNRVPLKISAVGDSSWTVPAVGTAFTAADTRIESLMLARFDTVKLSLRFDAADVATCQIKFKEVPYEVQGGSAETIGETMGPMVTRAFLYVFTVKYPGATQVWRFTDFERQLTDADENNYIAEPFENDDITETATIERQSVNIKSRNFAGNPLGLMVPFDLEWPLLIQIYEADVAGNAVSNLRCYFNGEITKCDTDGPFLSATAQSLSSLFDRQIPRRLIQPGCNWILFEGKCGLLQADWQWTGEVSDYDPDLLTLTLTSVTSTNAAALVAHFFAGGFLSVGVGNAAQYRMIVDSTAVAGDSLQLVLANPFTTAPGAGVTVTFHPGCDGMVSTCRNKFNNFVNFGGFPFTPAANPSMFQTTQAAYGGGKK